MAEISQEWEILMDGEDGWMELPGEDPESDRRLNCWEFMTCGREPGGSRTDELGVCPAAVDRRFHGVHGGISAGRACWVIAGTFCEGEAQGTFAQKYKHCGQCRFYEYVKAEESESLIPTITLLKMLK